MDIRGYNTQISNLIFQISDFSTCCSNNFGVIISKCSFKKGDEYALNIDSKKLVDNTDSEVKRDQNTPEITLPAKFNIKSSNN